MGPIRLIASDLDGTLIGSDRRISRRNVEALHAAIASGVTVLLSSGRGFRSIAYVARTHELDVPILSCNGAAAHRSPGGERIFAHHMPLPLLARVIDAANACGVAYQVFCETTTYCGREHPPTWLHNIYEPASKGEERTPLYCLPSDEVLAAVDGIAHKAIAFHDDLERLARFRAAMEASPDVDVSSSWFDNVEVMPRGISKGAGLLAFAEAMGIAPGDIMAIGDQENDLSMLEAAGVSVAMGNAPDWIQRRATYVTGSCDDDGVAQAIERYAL